MNGKEIERLERQVRLAEGGIEMFRAGREARRREILSSFKESEEKEDASVYSSIEKKIKSRESRLIVAFTKRKGENDQLAGEVVILEQELSGTQRVKEQIKLLEK